MRENVITSQEELVTWGSRRVRPHLEDGDESTISPIRLEQGTWDDEQGSDGGRPGAVERPLARLAGQGDGPPPARAGVGPPGALGRARGVVRLRRLRQLSRGRRRGRPTRRPRPGRPRPSAPPPDRGHHGRRPDRPPPRRPPPRQGADPDRPGGSRRQRVGALAAPDMGPPSSDRLVRELAAYRPGLRPWGGPWGPMDSPGTMVALGPRFPANHPVGHSTAVHPVGAGLADLQTRLSTILVWCLRPGGGLIGCAHGLEHTFDTATAQPAKSL